MERNRGFSLLELVIVVSIIGILAAIGIPNLLRARMQSNEASAIRNLRHISTAQVSYNTVKDTYGDFAALIDEADCPGTGFLTTEWIEGREIAGYQFSIPLAAIGGYECFADPVTPGVTGVRYFRIDGSGIVRFATGGRPGPGDPEIAN